MPRIFTALLRVAAIAIPIGFGGLAVAFSSSLKTPPEVKEQKRPTTPVRVLTLSAGKVVPRVYGYGVVEPAREWRAVARVEGEITSIADTLANGLQVRAGETLLRIDDADIRLSLAQIDAQLASIEVKAATLEASAEVNRADLELSRADLQRQQDLFDQGVAPRATRDQAARQELAARAKVVEIENQLALNLAEKAVLEAQRATAARSLEFTEITAPYDLRIGEVQVDAGQYVSRGQTLFAGDGIDAVEVSAQFPIGRMAPLVRSGSASPGAGAGGLSALVRLQAPGHVVEWQAEVARVGDLIDPRTQSVNVVVKVAQPIDQAVPGERPPLRRNMFVEVELRGAEMAAVLAPASAVQDGKALVVTAEGKIEPRSVEILFRQGDVAVIAAGLAAGDQLVVADRSIVTPGQVVKPVEDKKLARQVAADAMGQQGSDE